MTTLTTSGTTMTSPTPGGRPVIVAGGISDSHTWNLVYLQLLLEEHGHRVVNLGPCVPENLLIAEALDHHPALIVVSSVNGHGYHDGMRTVTRLREHPELAAVPAVIGGKLGICGPCGDEESVALRAAGYDAVFDDSADGVATFTRMLATLPQRALV
ncbi:cobalamin B12-binding domain-containing protein [Streptomyces sp. NPDC059477]|uniref:cobalamin B12-binding domain-containing protein n=1 Tax=Streptomyces sp. NPDC059477 TaxID=3346847 RepID=UPI00369BDD95